MKVIYDDIEYTINPQKYPLFKALFEEGIEEVELNLYHDVFVKLIENKVDYETSDPEYLYMGLSYFGVENEFVAHLKNKIYTIEKDILQKEITDFFEKYIDKVDWRSLCQNKSIPVYFFEKHIDKVNWDSIGKNSSLPLWFFEKYESKMTNINGAPIYFLEKHLDRIDWLNLPLFDHVPIDFYERHIDKVDFDYMWYNRHLTLNFIERNMDRIVWGRLCTNEHIPLKFFKKYIDKVNWSALCLNKSIPESFFEEHLDKVDFGNLIDNKNISLTFLEKHLHKINFTQTDIEYNELNIFHRNYDRINYSYLYNSVNIVKKFFKDAVAHDFRNVQYDVNMTPNFLEQMIRFFIINPNFPIHIFDRYSNSITNWTLLCCNTFNLEKRVLEKIKNTKYFDYDTLNILVKR